MSKPKLGENIAREWGGESQAPELWDALQLVKTAPPAGIEMLEQLANNGSCLAKVYLGDILIKGKHGVPEDRAAGESWLKRSADEGSVEGAYGLAWHFLNSGHTDAALTEYDRLADLGYPPALYALGALYYKGRVVERDLPKALHYFLRGEAVGHFYAANWAYRILMRGELGLRARFRGLAKMFVMFGPFLRTVLNYPNSDRLRF
jgi:TPR repeat protein